MQVPPSLSQYSKRRTQELLTHPSLRNITLPTTFRHPVQPCSLVWTCSGHSYTRSVSNTTRTVLLPVSSKLFFVVLATESARSLCLDWMVTALSSKRQQLLANERLVAEDGFILNLVSVILQLGSKVSQDKLDPAYLQTDITDGSMLKATINEMKEFFDNPEKGKDQNFPIVCWFLSLQALHIGILPIIRRFNTQVSPRTDINIITSGTREVSEHKQGRKIWLMILKIWSQPGRIILQHLAATL